LRQTAKAALQRRVGHERGAAGMGAIETFKRMDESTREQWQHILVETQAHQAAVPKEILRLLRSLDAVYTGFGVSQLHQAISILNHAQIGAAILQPYVSDDTYQIILTHQDFQGRHYYEYFGRPGNLREQYANEPWFAAAEQFTDEWDQAAFDPDYPIEPLEAFEPLVQQFFGRFSF
jgi:hypothetical protein